MDTEQIAKALDGIAYGVPGQLRVIPLAVEKSAKENGIVIVYGESDDNIEFRGAIDDELGAWSGGFFFLTQDGLLKSECDEGTECPYFKKALAKASKIEAIWDGSEIPWTYETDIPHHTFMMNEDNQPWCQGIVFYLKDAKE